MWDGYFWLLFHFNACVGVFSKQFFYSGKDNLYFVDTRGPINSCSAWVCPIMQSSTQVAQSIFNVESMSNDFLKLLQCFFDVQ